MLKYVYIHTFGARLATSQPAYIGSRPKRPILPPRYTIYYFKNSLKLVCSVKIVQNSIIAKHQALPIRPVTKKFIYRHRYG